MNYCGHSHFESTDLLWAGRKVYCCTTCQVLFTREGSVTSVKRREDCAHRDSGSDGRVS